MLHQSDGLFQTADGELVPATYAARNLYAQRRTHTTLTAQRKKTIKIEGMMCCKCEGHVNKALAALDGVTVEKVDHEAGVAVVECADSVSDDALKAAVEEAGYDFKGIA